jgi:hypothetical protein
MVASKSQFGRNYIITGEQLLPNQFISSNNGSMILIMQSDGNLVLYGFTKQLGCSRKDDKNIGDKSKNALYEITEYGQPKNMGKLAFIDQNSDLHEYPNDNKQYINDYTTIRGLDTPNNDIPNAWFDNSTLEKCKAACDLNKDCGGFVTNSDATICWPKTDKLFPFGGTSMVNKDRNIYIRNKKPLKTPIGVSQNTNNIDSITYQQYNDGGTIPKQYGLANINTTQKQQLDSLQTKLNLLSSQLNGLTGNFNVGTINAENQAINNVNGINSYLKDINKTNNKITNVVVESNGNISNILKDSDIVVLQNNYNYLFWSILAAGTVLVSMNIINK